MKLYGSTTSPYVRKVRAVLAEKKLEYQFVPENVWAADTQITSINPLGKIPVLELKAGDMVYDSRVIVEYLDTLSPVGKLIPSVARDRLEVKVWEALADGVLDAAVAARLEATWEGRSTLQRCQPWIERQMHKVDAGLAEMARLLADKPYCIGGVHPTLADIAVGCALGWLSFRFPDLDWRSRHPTLTQLLTKLEQRPSFVDTMPG